MGTKTLLGAAVTMGFIFATTSRYLFFFLLDKMIHSK